MDSFYIIIFCGLLALLFFILSAIFIKRKKYYFGLSFGVLELLSAAVSSFAWAWALKVSGKTDWFLLGLFGYTPVALIFWSMLIVGILCILVNIRGLVKKGKSSSTVVQG